VLPALWCGDSRAAARRRAKGGHVVVRRTGAADLSTFTPTSIRFDPPGQPDDLGGAVSCSLARPLPDKASWGPVKTLVLGAISLGILPLLILPRRLRWFAAGQNQLLRHTKEWLGLETGAKEAVEDETPPAVLLVCWVGLVAIGAVLLTYVLRPGFTS